MEKHKVLQIVGLWVILCGAITWAQVTTGTISGTVKDSSGAVLPKVRVVVLNEDTGISRTLETDAAGRYAALSLSLGNYRVTGTLEGFQPEVRAGIVLTVGREAVVDLTLAVGAVTQTVEVIGEAPLVESTTASLGSLVGDRTIRELPLNGRSYDQLALLQPGVILTSPGLLTSGSPFNFGSGKPFSVGGQRVTNNSFLLDGTNINDSSNGTPGGAAGLMLGVDTILEFKVFTSSFKAEYGHVTGSVVSSVTRSGTNTLHGTAFEYIRNSALDARNFFDVGSSPPSFRRNQFGGVIGGPIKKDKTFFFAGYEGLRQALATTLTATVPSLTGRQGITPTGTIPVNPGILPYINLYPPPNGRDFGDGTAQFLSAPTVPTTEDNFMVRVDHQLNDKTSIFGRYSFDNDGVTQVQNLPEYIVHGSSRRQYATLQANSVLSAKALNNFRFAYNRSSDLYASTWVPFNPQLSIVPGEPLGAVSIGAPNVFGVRPITGLGVSGGSGPTFSYLNNFIEADDFTYVTGKHTIKAGVDIERYDDNYASETRLYGQYSFASFQTFLAGTPSVIQASTPLGVPPYFGYRQTMFSVYGQDDYTVNSRLTLNLGLRWEAPTDPVAVNGQMSILESLSASTMTISNKFFTISKKNFEPRVGLAWRLDESGKTVLRAGGGIYHNQILPWLYEHQMFPIPFFKFLSGTNPPFPTGGYEALNATGLVALQANSPFEKTPTDYQWNLSLQRELFKNTVLQLAYAGNHGNHLPDQREADTAIPTFINGNLGDPFYAAGAPWVNPTFAGMRYYENVADSNYNSVTATLRRTFATGFQGQIFYTFAKATDENVGTSASDSSRSAAALLNPYNRNADWGLSDYNSKNALGANFSYQLPFRAGSKALGAVVNGWTLNGIGTFTSGLPFSALLASAVSRDLSSVLSERPSLTPGFSQNPTSGVSAGCNGFPAGSPVGTANNWYDPCAFSLPVAGTYGNVGRNTIIGPGVSDVDLSLEKNFKLSERANAMFRVEMFNIMNHANFGLPNTSPLAATGAANGSAGVIIYTTTSSRQLQFALRISF